MLCREALEGMRATFGNRHPNTLTDISNLANLHVLQGNHAAAEPLHREALEGYRETLGDQHPHTLRLLRDFVEARHITHTHTHTTDIRFTYFTRTLTLCSSCLLAPPPTVGHACA